MVEPFFACQIEACAVEISYPADMLSMWNDKPICEECYHEISGEDDPMWADLPSFIPEHETKITNLKALNAELVSELKRITELSPGGPHISAKDGMGAALATLDRARDIARAAIAKAESEAS